MSMCWFFLTRASQSSRRRSSWMCAMGAAEKNLLCRPGRERASCAGAGPESPLEGWETAEHFIVRKCPDLLTLMNFYTVFAEQFLFIFGGPLCPPEKKHITNNLCELWLVFSLVRHRLSIPDCSTGGRSAHICGSRPHTQRGPALLSPSSSTATHWWCG